MGSVIKNQAEMGQLFLAINYVTNYRHFERSIIME